MFDRSVYAERRMRLIDALDSGIVLLPGNGESPMNYKDNMYPFRQDSTFLYYCGLTQPDLTLVIDIDSGESTLFGTDFTISDIIWMGPQESLAERAVRAGIEHTEPSGRLREVISKALKDKRKIHFIPPYRTEQQLQLSDLLGICTNSLNHYVSTELITAIVRQRSVKAEAEIDEIEQAMDITRRMHVGAMRLTEPDKFEYEIVGEVLGIAASGGGQFSFPIIFSTHGETLHNHYHGNRMKTGDIVVHDSGAETAMGYAADITRTIPVSGRFSPMQREIYEIVLSAQTAAIGAVEPGVMNRDVHLTAARAIASGLKSLGLMSGDAVEAVAEGAHALFFPHGIGHMMGLDVHDMENLGEKYVGYDQNVDRSDQFGLASLRLAKKLQPGYVLTIEPGVYFIPPLIEQWRAEKKHEEFIQYDEISRYLEFGGIRIEDDVLVTDDGHRILGREPIPKTVDDVENTCAG